MPKTMWAEGRVRPAMGHQFEDKLDCKYCNRQWVTHQRDPQKCNKYAMTEDALTIGAQETK